MQAREQVKFFDFELEIKIKENYILPPNII